MRLGCGTKLHQAPPLPPSFCLIFWRLAKQSRLQGSASNYHRAALRFKHRAPRFIFHQRNYRLQSIPPLDFFYIYIYLFLPITLQTDSGWEIQPSCLKSNLELPTPTPVRGSREQSKDGHWWKDQILLSSICDAGCDSKRRLVGGMVTGSRGGQKGRTTYATSRSYIRFMATFNSCTSSHDAKM